MDIRLDDVAVVSPAYYGDDRSAAPARMLKESADILGIPIRFYGLGKPWPGLIKAKMDDLIEFLDNTNQTYTLFTDSFDCFFVGDLKEILWKYSSLGRPDILCAAERNCYPNAELAPCFVDPGNRTPYIYPCPGNYIGRTVKIAKHLRILRYEYRDMPEPWAGNDQAYWHAGWSEGLTVALDRYCRIFQLMGGEPANTIALTTPGRFINNETHTTPSILHFNGRSGGDGVMETYFNQWKSIQGRSIVQNHARTEHP